VFGVPAPENVIWARRTEKCGSTREGIEFEQHFSCKEIAEMSGFSPAKVRRMFQKEQDVMKVGEPSRRLARKLRRTYITLSIPESIVRARSQEDVWPKGSLKTRTAREVRRAVRIFTRVVP
jgi:hypothetical protein